MCPLPRLTSFYPSSRLATVSLGLWHVNDIIASRAQTVHYSAQTACLLNAIERSSSPSSPKGKGLVTCYSAAYTSQTRDQQRFTISEVAADWHEPMVPIASSAWWGFTPAADRQRLEAVIRRAIRSGLCDPDQLSLAELVAAADEDLHCGSKKTRQLWRTITTTQLSRF